jgi:hypothetical protein
MAPSQTVFADAILANMIFSYISLPAASLQDSTRRMRSSITAAAHLKRYGDALAWSERDLRQGHYTINNIVREATLCRGSSSTTTANDTRRTDCARLYQMAIRYDTLELLAFMLLQPTFDTNPDAPCYSDLRTVAEAFVQEADVIAARGVRLNTTAINMLHGYRLRRHTIALELQPYLALRTLNQATGSPTWTADTQRYAGITTVIQDMEHTQRQLDWDPYLFEPWRPHTWL